MGHGGCDRVQMIETKKARYRKRKYQTSLPKLRGKYRKVGVNASQDAN